MEEGSMSPEDCPKCAEAATRGETPDHSQHMKGGGEESGEMPAA